MQYLSPLWKVLAAAPELDVTVFYFSDFSVRGAVDPGFGVEVSWDAPLLDGYRSEFISGRGDSSSQSWRLPAAADFLGRCDCDVVLIQGYTYPFERQLIRAARRSGVRVIMRGEFSELRARGVLKRMIRRRYLTWFYSRVDAFCYIGEDAREHLRSFGIPDSRLFFSPYSVDTAQFEAQIQRFDRDSSRQRLGVGPDHFCFLFCGKLIPRKEPLLLLAALEKLAERERLALIVVGDGPLLEEVTRQGRALLGSRFVNTGFVNQSQLGEYYRAADAFVLPSNHETWGLVVNEAMQFSLPVVVSNRVGCHRDLVANHGTGFVFESGDCASLAAALRKIVASPAEAGRMGRKARRHVAAYSTEESARGIRAAVLNRTRTSV